MLTKTKTNEQRQSRDGAEQRQRQRQWQRQRSQRAPVSAREQRVTLSLLCCANDSTRALSLPGCARCTQYNSITATTRGESIRWQHSSSEDEADVNDVDADAAGVRWDRLLKVVGALRPSSLKANAVNDRHSGPLFPYTDTETGSWTRVVHCSRTRSRSRNRRSRCNFKCSKAKFPQCTQCTVGQKRNKTKCKAVNKSRVRWSDTHVQAKRERGRGNVERGTCVNASCRASVTEFWLILIDSRHSGTQCGPPRRSTLRNYSKTKWTKWRVRDIWCLSAEKSIKYRKISEKHKRSKSQ